jgi:hypothetical protein
MHKELTMQRFRAFNSASWGDDLPRMERAINDWLESDHPHIHMMAQANLDSHLIVSFVYADSFQMATTAEAATVAEVFERRLGNARLEEEAEGIDEDGDLVVTLPLVELPY